MRKNKKNIKADAEIKDPFSGSIDEFLKEKEQKENSEDQKNTDVNETTDKSDSSPAEDTVDTKSVDTPQDSLEDSLEEETGQDIKPVDTADSPNEQMAEDVKDESGHDVTDTETEKPQDVLEEKSEEVQEDAQDDHIEQLEEQKKHLDDQIDTLSDEQENKIESSLKRIAADINRKGFTSLASLFLKVAGGVPEILNKLLMKEYLLLDILNNYFYLIPEKDGSLYTMHDPKDAIKYLQKQIVSLGGVPTTQRTVIPKINPASFEGVLALVKEHEKFLVADYQSALKLLTDPNLAVLAINLQNIINKKRKLF